PLPPCLSCFFFTDTATTEIYTLSLHDALPICPQLLHELLPLDDAGLVEHVERLGVRHPLREAGGQLDGPRGEHLELPHEARHQQDRKSTRLNSSHMKISYAVFCLKKKKKKQHK